jgi:hypothetical protein
MVARIVRDPVTGKTNEAEVYRNLARGYSWAFGAVALLVVLTTIVVLCMVAVSSRPLF